MREIDRSKTVTVVSILEDPVGLLKQIKNTKSECPWIKIRFPFSKKTIMDLQDTLLSQKKKKKKKKKNIIMKEVALNGILNLQKTVY